MRRDRGFLCRRRSAQLECAQGLGCATPERADEVAVVVVGDLAGAVVELELLQRGECTITFLGQREAPLLQLVGASQTIIPGGRLTQERESDERNTCDRQDDTDDQRGSQIRTAASA
jgi:hypothetical protein